MALDTKQPKNYRKAWNGSFTPQPPNWCRDERLKLGRDVLIEETDGYTLVRCLGEFSAQNIHAGKWIIWDRDGKCVTVGREAWARKKFSMLTVKKAL